MRFRKSILLGILLLLPLVADAQVCVVNANSLHFGQYDGFSTVPKDSTTTITVICAPGTAFVVKIGPGIHSEGSYNPRMMILNTGNAKMAYSLFTDPSFTRIWGNGEGDTQVVSGVGTGEPKTYVLYGRIPPRQNHLIPGSYSDQVVISVEY